MVEGEHESLFFTIETPNSTVSNTENYETYDSRRFWATYPGTYTITAQLYSEGNLSGILCDEMTLTFVIEDCADICTGEITSFQINAHNGTPLQTLTDGQVLCASDFETTDVSIRALVDGEHESLYFTIETPNGTVSNTENHVTYDSRRFWATYPGTYTCLLYTSPSPRDRG